MLDAPQHADAADNDAPSREAELKLDLDPADADRLAGWLTGRLGEPRRVPLYALYYDTPDLALADAGLSLRVRSEGTRMVQTVKAGGGAATGFFDRSEWEHEVASHEPDLSAAAKTGAGPLLSRKRVRKHLVAVFTVEVTRLVWLQTEEGSTVEVALDRGTVKAGDAAVDLCEIEIELKHGNAEPVFRLARELDAVAPLRLGVRTKAERGGALVAGTSAGVVRAETPALTPDMPAAAAFVTIVASCLRHFRRNEAGVTAQGEVEALHQARVAMRRLRSALSLFAPMIRDARFDGLRTRLQTASRQLGEARSLDVFLAGALEDRIEGGGDAVLAHGTASLVERAEARREAAYAAMRTLLDGAEFRGLMLDLAAWLQTGPWTLAEDMRHARETPVIAAAAAILTRRRKGVLRKGRRLGALSVERRHRLRIAIKKLRYAADFFERLYANDTRRGRRHERFGEALAEAQETLGALNDIASTEDLTRKIAASRTSGTEAPPEPSAPDDQVPDPAPTPSTPEAAFAAGDLAAGQQARVARLIEEAEAALRRLGKVKPYWR